MTRHILTGFVALAVAAAMSAAPLTPDEALARMRGSDKAMAMRGTAASAMRLEHTARTSAGEPAAYVFNRAGGDGYVILAADDMAYPVLGYSDHGSADAADMPPQLVWWLGEYARQIEYAAQHGYDRNRRPLPARADMTPIEPMVTARWNQGAPYNNDCPLYGGKRTYTGCVATAMAQVMKYWKYPEVGTGKISYECSNIQKRLALDFSEKKFDWSNMPDTYLPGQYSDAEAGAVAYLMKAAGYSVRMNYGTDSSGALAMNIAGGLTRYFGYDANMQYVMRSYYSATQWAELLYDNLRNIGPVLYGGGSMLGGGHSFVCDGYDGEGMFHFNWGWSGMSDGYFSLDALNPDALGAGGGAGGGYNFTQDAVLGIQPPTGKPVEPRPLVLNQVGSLAGYMNGNNLCFDLFGNGSCMWVNYNADTMKVRFGVRFDRQVTGDSEASEPVYAGVSNKQFSIRQGYGTDVAHMEPQVDLSVLNLSDGVYKVTMCTLELENEDAQWQPVRADYGCYNSIVLRKVGNTYKVDVEMIGTIEVTGAEILNTLYDGGMAKVRLNLRNNEDYEITGGFAPAFFYKDGEQYYVAFLGESIMVSMPPKSETTRELTTSIYALQGAPQIFGDTPLKFSLFDEMVNGFLQEECFKDVVMKPNPGMPALTVTLAPRIVGATASKVNTSSGILDMYLVKDPTDIEVRSKFRLDSGLMCYDAMAAVLVPSKDNPGYMEVYDYSGHPVFMETAGEEYDFTTHLSMPDMVADEVYYLVMTYGYNQSLETMGRSNHTSLFRLDTSSVAETAPGTVPLSYDGGVITADGQIDVYTLQGVLVASGENRVYTEALPAGVYVARAGAAVIKFTR